MAPGCHCQAWGGERALQHIHQGQQGTDCLLQETASVLWQHGFLEDVEWGVCQCHHPVSKDNQAVQSSGRQSRHRQDRQKLWVHLERRHPQEQQEGVWMWHWTQQHCGFGVSARLGWCWCWCWCPSSTSGSSTSGTSTSGTSTGSNTSIWIFREREWWREKCLWWLHRDGWWNCALRPHSRRPFGSQSSQADLGGADGWW